MEDTVLRFSLAAQLNRMRYGQSRIITREAAQTAWPPTGDHDRSLEAAFRAMALASGGNRPETSHATEERIRNDLDDSFSIVQSAIDGDWKIHRRLSCCPHCGGRGFARKLPELEFSCAPGEETPSTEKIVFDREPCDHVPKPI